jgi:hypothetical protein
MEKNVCTVVKAFASLSSLYIFLTAYAELFTNYVTVPQAAFWVKLLHKVK